MFKAIHLLLQTKQMKSEAGKMIVDAFRKKGNLNYATDPVTQLEHALQCAMMAENAGAGKSLILAALLHDIGHILDKNEIPDSLSKNLDDKHEESGYQFLKKHFGREVAEPVRLHVAAKRYLCAVQPDYILHLSPTSIKSLKDQRGPMKYDEMREFEANPYFPDAVLLRKWDDAAKMQNTHTKSLEQFLEFLL
jgi:[1-hydroxy-2-(trimethylamino)ethyl]phosphonate dioxygenase